MQIRRLPQNPIITPELDASIGTNINGPSLIRVPEWLDRPLGRYYLYFADHNGAYIRLAYADALDGPWRIHVPGVLRREQTIFRQHIASPDVHVDHAERRIRMYFHGCCRPEPPQQATCAALSPDGLAFTARPEDLGAFYWRVFVYDGWYYTLEMPGLFRRSRDPLGGFVAGPQLFTVDMRHSAVLLDGDTLRVFWSNAHDCPEQILTCTIDLRPDWLAWQATPPEPCLRPELPWEGANLPLEPSRRGGVTAPARQLRDPAVFREDGRAYLLYSVAGESGIGIAEIVE